MTELLKCMFILCCMTIFMQGHCRPQNSMDLEGNNDLNDNMADITSSSYYSYPSQIILDNKIPLERLLYNSYIPRINSVPLEGLYKMAKAKRQTRYRQCYFNPVSCFKK
ncbi:hypothetical protein ACFFRR_005308 [Megaselia abdita]